MKLNLLTLSSVLLSLSLGTRAGSFTSDFNSGLSTGATLNSTAVISPNDGTGGGYTNSGCLQLTTAGGGAQTTSFIITNDLDNGTAVVSFTASFKLWLGTPYYDIADGFSFNFAPDLPLTDGISEEGAGTGYTVEFDTFNNNDGYDTAPAVGVKVGPGYGDHGLYTGLELADASIALRKDGFVDCVIQLNPNNTLTVVYDGAYALSNVDLSASAYAPVAGSLFGLGARCGSITENAWVDDLNIVTRTYGAPFVNSFLPAGSAVATNSPIDIVLTDFNTRVNTNTIMLKLNGTPIAPRITQDAAGNTLLHYVKSSSLGHAVAYTVDLSFSDDATPTPHQLTWRYNFQTLPAPPAPPAPVVIFSDNFEGYSLDALDKDLAGGPNAAANGTGNPWFGPAPPNLRVVNAENGITPHSGTNMIRGNPAGFDYDQDWYNLAYRLRGGQPIYGNCVLDWWFYDPTGPGDATYCDYIALGYYNTAPSDTDYPGSGSLNSGLSQVQRVSVGGAGQTGSGFDGTKYQCRNVSASGYSGGWNNTTAARSIGWHHARIVVGPPTNNLPIINWFVDDMTNPAFTQQSGTSFGFNVIEINAAFNATLAYYDDISFALTRPPNPTITRSGNTLSFSWPAGFTLQGAPEPAGPWSDLSTAYTGFTYDLSVGEKQFFRLKN